MLPETLFGETNFDILYYIVAANERLDVVFLLSPSSSFRESQRNASCAMACRDADDNLFLLRRRNGCPIAGQENLALKLIENRRPDQTITVERKGSLERFAALPNLSISALAEPVARRIKDWSIRREDLGDLFPAEEKDHTTGERRLINYLRGKSINPERLISFLENGVQPAI
jgi:hypothetical protein